MDSNPFFQQLWQHYSAMTPQAGRIHALFEQHNDRVVNDHVAFRTFRRAPFDIASLEPHLFNLGYRRDRFYDFPDKKLHAWSYISEQPDQPLIFFSELLPDRLTDLSRAYIERLLREAQSRLPQDATAFNAGRLWTMPSWDEYCQLEQESDYAAWLSLWGFCANHFTVSVNRLSRHNSLEAVVDLLRQQGFALNDSGGVIKGSPDALLEQTSTLADTQTVTFRDGSVHPVPTCYYEFARRYPGPNGELFQGFVPQSADKIFQSTDRQKG